MSTAGRPHHPLALAIAIGLTAFASTPAAAQRMVVDDGSEQVADGDYATTATGEAGHAIRARNPGSRITGDGVTASSAASSTLLADEQGRIEFTNVTLRSPFQSGYVAWADSGGAITLDDSRFELTPSTSAATTPSTALGATGGGTIRMRGGSIESTGNRIAHAAGTGSVIEMRDVAIEAGGDPHLAGTFRATDGGRLDLRQVTYVQPTNAARLLHASGAGSRIEVEDSRFEIDGVPSRTGATPNAAGAVYARDGGHIVLGADTVVSSNRAGAGVAGPSQSISVFAVGAGSAITLDNATIDARGDMMVGAAAVDGGQVDIRAGSHVHTDGTSSSSFGVYAEGTDSAVSIGAATVNGGRHGAEARHGGSITVGAGADIVATAPGARGLVANMGGTVVAADARIAAYGHTADAPAYGVFVRGGRDGSLAPSTAVLGPGTIVDTDGVGLVLDAAQALQGVRPVWVAPQLTAENIEVTGAVSGAATLQGSTLSLFDSSIEGGTSYALRVYDADARAQVSGGRLALTAASGADAAAIQLRNGTLLLQDGVEVTSSNGVLLLDPGDGLGTLPTTAELRAVQLSGDLVTRHRDRSTVLLRDGSTLAGGMIGSQHDPDELIFLFQKDDAHGWNVDIDPSSGWQVTGDSDIRSIRLGGALSFAAPGADGDFSTLAVYGDYVGDGGTITFNTRLGDDTSATDRMIVGGDTSGATGVSIVNAGGTGAATVEGIRLIRVDGASDGVFTLAGRAVAGSHDYFLHQGSTSAPADGHWYLRSQALPPAPDPDPAPGPEPTPDPAPDPEPTPDPDPAPPPTAPLPAPGAGPSQPSVPIYRPEPGTYLANLAAVDLFAHSLHERQGEQASNGAPTGGAWTRIARNQLTTRSGADQVDNHTHTMLLQVGADFAGGEFGRGTFNLGAMLGTGHAHTRSQSNLSGYRAKGQLQGQVAGLYATWRAPASASYVDGWLQYGDFRNEVQGDHLAIERYDSTAWSASIEAGHSFELARGARTRWHLQPQLQVIYSRHDADDHVEANGTRVEFVEGESLVGRLGARVYAEPVSTIGNRVQPYAGLHWRHANSDYVVALDGDALQQRQPDNLYEASLGLAFELGAGWAGWTQFGWQRGDGGHRNVSGLLGLRYQW